MWEMQEQRHYRGGSVSSERLGPPPGMPSTSEDLHAWSIYRQNLNSDFTDSALGSSEKSPAPYGNFHLRDQTVQSILANPKYGPRSELGNNMYTYLKFGLPRVLAPRGGGSSGITKGKEAMKIFTACSVFPTVSILSKKKIILKITLFNIQNYRNLKMSRNQLPTIFHLEKKF